MTDYVETNLQEDDKYILKMLESNPEMWSKSDFMEIMKYHTKLGLDIYRRAIELNMQNEQEFMTWQDELNAVTFVHTEDL